MLPNRRGLVLCVALLATVPAAAFAQTPLAENAKGFSPTGTFEASGIDHVNLYSGGVTMAVPLGPSYPIGAGLSQQLHFVYNSKIWRPYPTCLVQGNATTGVYVTGSPAFGTGWTLEMGHIVDPPNQPGFGYAAPDGSVHLFKSTATANVYRTNDGSFIQALVSLSSDGSKAVSAVVYFPDGLTGIFSQRIEASQVNHGATSRDFDSMGLYLSKLSNHFGDYLQVTYSAASDGSLQVQKIYHYGHDAAGHAGVLLRTINLTFTIPPGSTWAVLTDLDLPAVQDSTGAARRQHIQLSYNSSGFARPITDQTNNQFTPCPSPSDRSSDFVSAPMLTLLQLDQNDPTLVYKFRYLQDGNRQQVTAEGLLEQVTLPSGGAVTYNWGQSFYTGSLPPPVQEDPVAPPPTWYTCTELPPCDRYTWDMLTATLINRTEYPSVDANGNPSGAGAAWKYSISGDYWYQVSEVEAPDGYIHRSLFNVEAQRSLQQANGLEYQTQFLDQNGHVVRTVDHCYNSDIAGTATTPICRLDPNNYQNFSLIDDNARESLTTTTDWSSGQAVQSAKIQRSQWDGYGHFGQDDTYDWGGASPLHTTQRSYAVATNSTCQSNWILFPETSHKEIEGSKTVATTLAFDCSTGFLQSTSTSDGLIACSGTSCGTVTEQFTADPSGAGNPTTGTYSSSGGGFDGRRFAKANAFANGVLSSSQSSGIGWKSPNLVLDANTGLVLKSFDPANFETDRAYDVLGRPVSISPPGEAATSISYDSPTQTTVSRTGSDGNSTWERYLYDGFGRLIREIRQASAASCSQSASVCYSVRAHSFDSVGRGYFGSEWASCSDLASTAASFGCLRSITQGTTSSNFDPFGRPQKVTQADGSTTCISFAASSASVTCDAASVDYSDSQKSFQVCVNGTGQACTGGTKATTTYRYDALGRLTNVTEPNGNTTSYGYNVLDRLAGVTQGSQIRAFNYDGMGLLRSEMTPEQGTVTYTQYDALGNLIKSKEPNNVTLTRAYSAAGRLTGLTSDETGSPTYLTNAWNDNGTGASLGRLTSRTSKTVTAGGGSVTATETMTYDPGTGRLTSRSLGFAPGATGLGTSWSYNSLGLIANTSNSVAGQETGKVSYGYSAGYPTTVSGEPAAGLSAQLAGNVSYTPYGGLSSIGLGNATTTQIASDPSLLPRPSSISNGSWSTGAYAYDGCGNILSIGSDSYRYDSLSRLISSTVQSQAQTFAYDRWGNMTQKGLQSFTIDPTKNQLSYQAGVVEYDLLGNLKTYGPQRFTYDTLSRQTDFTNNGVVTESYVYDGAGERVARFAAAPALPPLMILNDTVESYCTSSLPITITLLASGGAGPPYTWTATGLTNGATLTSGGILTLPNAGTYSLMVTVKDSANNTLSASLTITVSTNCDGIFDNEPQDAIICPGGVYSASALAHYGDGTYAASYTWKTYVGKSWVAASGTTTPCSFAGGLLTGSCFSAYPSQSPTYYQVTATKSGGTGATSSRIATVSVGGAIQITHSQNDLLCAGQEVNLSDLFTAMGCNLSTTWQQKNADGSWSNLSNDLVSPTQTTFYRAVLQADEPPQTVNSPSIEVDVLPQPVLTQAPASQNVCAGSPVTLSATANTSGNFKWEHYDGKKWIQDKYNVNPTTSDSATLTPAQTAPYRVSVTTYCGVYTGNFTLTQVTLPTVSGIAPSLTICPPQAVSYAATVSGATSLQWQQSSDGVNWSNIAGATSAAYTTPVLTNTTLNQVSYRCRLSATNSCGTTYASSVITVQPQPQASITGSACSVAAGQPTTLTCTASDFSPQYSWSPGGQTTPSITVSPTTTTTYTCYVREATTGCNSTAASYVVTVGSQVNSPVITANPVSQTICSGSSSAALSGAATGTNVAYQWQKQNADSSWSNVSGATSSTYVAPAVNATYRMAASNACGSVYSAPATVTVDASKQSAAITVQPQSVYYCKGGSATLSVGATGTALSYRWESSTDRSFWSPVVGGGSATINVAPTSVIYYHVVVWNVCDTVTSNVVTATQVPSAPTITTQPAGGAICGSGYAMHVATSADFLGATYQWQVSSGSWTNIAGATSNSYTATAAGGYRVIVTDACGSVTSNQALVSVGTMPGQPTIAGDSFIYSGQSAHLTISNARFDWAYAYWSDGQVTTPPFDRYVSPTTTTSYSVYVTGPSYSCPSPSSAPFQVTVGGGNGALYGGYQSGSTTSGESPAQTSSVAAAGTIVLLHAAPDGKSNKTLSVVRSPGDRILAGDWNGDGVGSLGFYDPTTGRFELWDGDPTGAPTYRFIFGPPGRFQPIVGDWDGDGIDTIGLYDAQTGRVWLKNQNAPGAPDAGYVFRLPFKNGIAIAGDWTGQGYDTVGVYDPQESVFYLKDSHKSGGPDHAVSFGPKAGGALPMSGDWNAQGLSAIGLYDGKTGRVYLRKTLTSGPPEYTQTFVPGLDQVFAGRWDALKHAPGPSARKVAVPVERPSSDSWPPSAPSTQSQRVSVAWPPSGWLAEAAWGGEGADSDQDAGGFQLAAYHSNRSAAPLSAQAATFTWYYTIRDENNRPSIEYHLNSAGTVVTDRIYAYLGNALIATYETANGTPGWVYYATDHLGSVRSAMASVNCTQAFLPFGEQVSSTCTTPPVKFAGMERDTASGNDYDHARYTGSTLGRFLSIDLLPGKAEDPQSWNRYAYAHNSPVNFLDPTGLDSFSCNSSGGSGNSNGSSGNDRGASAVCRQTDEVLVTAQAPPATGVQGLLENASFGIAKPLLTLLTSTDLKELAMSGLEIGATAVTGGLLGSLAEGMEAAVGTIAAESEGATTIGGAATVRVGQAGETAVRAAYDIGPKTAIRVGQRLRIPDGLTENALSEVKNVRSQSYTQQLRDFAAYAAQKGLRFDLYVREITELSGPLKEAIQGGVINLRYIP